MTAKNFNSHICTETCADEKPVSRRRVLQGAGAIAAAGGLSAGSGSNSQAAGEPGCGVWLKPTDDDFANVIGRSKEEVVDRVLSVIEREIVPLTMKGVQGGSKLFGGAVLSKADLSTVVASTNNETGNPLLHGEIQTINTFYALPKEKRPSVADTIFVTTHEPCPLCLSGISWAGFNNFFYLFTYEDTRDAYGIPHDLTMLESVFRCPDGTYSEKNVYWSSWSIRGLIAETEAGKQAAFKQRMEALKVKYGEMSDIYQKAKAEGKGADVPLK